jgi:L-asparagine permease
LAGRFTVEGAATGPSILADNGGLFPTGLLALVVVTSGVVFAYASVELVGTAAGETENPEKVMPKAINAVVIRIAVFYVGSLILLALLLPYTLYKEGESPFVTFFSRVGLPYAGDIMNFVVLTAALSSLNAGLYSTGRILRSMSMNGSAPQLLSRMSSNGVPFAGIALTACFTVVGVFMNMVIPAKAFETALDVAALGIIASWATIVICQLRLYQWTQRGILQRGKFQMPGAPYTGYATLIFLLVVLVLMCYENYWNLVALGIFTPLLIIGWYLSKERVMQLARERVGYTGQYPVIAETPMMDDPPNLGDK